MSAAIGHRFELTLDLPGDLARLSMPAPLARRLQHLLDRQDDGDVLTDEERAEAESLVELSDLMALLRLRATRAAAAA